ncbi:MAG TPA: hypothetical protein VGM80_11775 [Gaiellaceae bacterium]
MKLRLLASALAAAAVFAAVAAAAPPPGPWKSVTIERHSGTVSATLTFERRKERYGAYDFKNMHLLVKNGSAKVLDRGMCAESRCSIASHHILSLRNVWGDAAPEVLLDTYTGGAHCCFESFIVLTDGGHAGRTISPFWGDPGYRLIGHAGTVAFESADDRFAYEFTAFAGSGLPIVLEEIGPHGGLNDVTQTRPDLIKADAKVFWKGYVSERAKADTDVRGVVAAWCADEYRLGLKAGCNAELKTALARGWLAGPGEWPQNAKFIALLHKQLAAWGYPTS